MVTPLELTPEINNTDTEPCTHCHLLQNYRNIMQKLWEIYQMKTADGQKSLLSITDKIYDPMRIIIIQSACM